MDNATMTPPEMVVLRDSSDADLAKMWCALNNGNLPAALIPYGPANWETLERQRKHDFLWPHMSHIMHRIGHKACLREWNHKDMTDEEFERWYRGGME